jgi:1,2-diacylglycerol 3-alpha-glucosyltransferase
MKVAINYISLGVHHLARLKAISELLTSHGIETICLEMFSKDSDYEWNRVNSDESLFRRITLFDGASDDIRKLPSLRREIRSFMNSIKPDVLVISGWSFPEALALLDWTKTRNVPAILLSDSQERDKRRVFYKEWLKKRRVSRFAAAYVAGKPQVAYVEKLGMRSDRIWTGSCVVDNDFWMTQRKRITAIQEQARAKMQLPEKYFLTVARLVAKKNIPTLLKAYALYRNSSETPLSLVICGDGPDRLSIEHIIRTEKMEGVHLTGFQQIDTLPYLYSLASCFILPSSHEEQWGLVVNEAMASGLPVIVSEICGCAVDLVRNGLNGFTFNPSDPYELSAKMTLVTCDEALCRQMGESSLAIVDEFSCGAAARNLLACVRAVTNS